MEILSTRTGNMHLKHILPRRERIALPSPERTCERGLRFFFAGLYYRTPMASAGLCALAQVVYWVCGACFGQRDWFKGPLRGHAQISTA